MYPTREKALELLREGEALNPGPWTGHSLTAAKSAEKIAACCGLDTEKAFVSGLLHDIGRRFGHTEFKHVMDGYHYLLELGYEDTARICLSHSFPKKGLGQYIGGIDIPEQEIIEAKALLDQLEYDDYDRLIQLCDSLSDSEGVVDMEARMNDVERRHNRKYPEGKREACYELRRYFENLAGQGLYEILESV